MAIRNFNQYQLDQKAAIFLYVFNLKMFVIKHTYINV